MFTTQKLALSIALKSITRAKQPSLLATLGLFVLLSLTGCGGGGSGSSAPDALPANDSVQLIRDSFGVPHIFAATDEGALYGLGWAMAEDRLFQMHWQRLVIRGRTAEFMGPDPGNGSLVYVQHDRRMRLGGYGRLADRLVGQLQPETRTLLQAFCDGINDFADQQSAAHPFFQSLDIPIEPWRPADCLAAWMRFGRLLGGEPKGEIALGHRLEDLLKSGAELQQAIEDLMPPSVFDEASAVVLESDVPANTRSAMQSYLDSFGVEFGAQFTKHQAWSHAGPHFSQAWAISGNRSGDGNARIYADPRLPLRLPSSLWEGHLNGATLEMRGFSVPGTPQFLVGSNRRVAWAITASNMDVADYYRLITDPAGHAGQYFLDGVWRDFEVDEVESIVVKGQASVQVSYRETRWGPVITRFPGDTLFSKEVADEEEYSLRWVQFANPSQIPVEAHLAMGRAETAVNFGAALENWSNPPANCIFADAQGRVGFWAVGSLPLRNPVLPSGSGGPGGPNSSIGALGGAGFLNGARSEAAWLDTVPHNLKPWVIDPNSGYLLSANHLPVGAWYPIPLVTHGGHTHRSARMAERLQTLLPTASAKLNESEFLSLHDDAVWATGRDIALLSAHAVQRLGFELSDTAGESLEMLTRWLDSQSDGVFAFTESSDGTLAAGAQAEASALALHCGQLPFRSIDPTGNGGGTPIDADLIETYGVGEPGLLLFLRTLRERMDADSNAAFSAAEVSALEAYLVDAWERTEDAAGDPSNWSDWYENDHLVRTVQPWTVIEGLPSLDPGGAQQLGPVAVAWNQTLAAPFNQAGSQSVRFEGGRSRASSLLPPGQAELSPQGQNTQDQLPLWTINPQILKASPLEQADIEDLVGPVQITVLDYKSEE